MALESAFRATLGRRRHLFPSTYLSDNSTTAKEELADFLCRRDPHQTSAATALHPLLTQLRRSPAQGCALWPDGGWGFAKAYPSRRRVWAEPGPLPSSCNCLGGRSDCQTLLRSRGNLGGEPLRVCNFRKGTLLILTYCPVALVSKRSGRAGSQRGLPSEKARSSYDRPGTGLPIETKAAPLGGCEVESYEAQSIPEFARLRRSHAIQ